MQFSPQRWDGEKSIGSETYWLGSWFCLLRWSPGERLVDHVCGSVVESKQFLDAKTNLLATAVVE